MTTTHGPKQAVLDLAAELGAAVESSRMWDGGPFEIAVEAPAGHHWKPDGPHELVYHADLTYSRQPADGWRDMLERMRQGVEPCGADCEYWEDQ